MVVVEVVELVAVVAMVVIVVFGNRTKQQSSTIAG
jgi:hypothetical protein